MTRAATVILSQYTPVGSLHQLLDRNADTGRGGLGYLLKDRVAHVRHFLGVVREKASGATIIDPDIVVVLVGDSRRRGTLATLTPREEEVLGLMAQGLANPQIAQRLVVSEAAVQKHVGGIFANCRCPTTVTVESSRFSPISTKHDPLTSSSMSDLPFRVSCRGLLLAGERILLAEHRIGSAGTVWVGPGGGMEAGESHHDALARELHEETGLIVTDDHVPQPVWIQTAVLPPMRSDGYEGVVNHYFLIRVDHFEPASGVTAGAAGHPEREGIVHLRWWTLAEIEAAHGTGVRFSPRALPDLLGQLLRDGVPPSPVAIGL
jgi:8-oxo-dGTP pyrophosphatase MutT (NUDIX family)